MTVIKLKLIWPPFILGTLPDLKQCLSVSLSRNCILIYYIMQVLYSCNFFNREKVLKLVHVKEM